MRSGNAIPFVGAGVSQAVRLLDGTSAFPSWIDLIKELNASVDSTVVDAHLSKSPPSLMKAVGELHDEIDGQLKKGLSTVGLNARIAKRFIVILKNIDRQTLQTAQHVWNINPHLVITTNYDDILEQACTHDSAATVTKYQRGMLADYQVGKANRPIVWHLHGHHSTNESIIFSSRDYERQYVSEDREREPSKHILEHLIASHSLVFVGFSFADQWILEQLDNFQVTYGKTLAKHFALIREADCDRLHPVFERLGVEFVTYSDHGQPLLDILARYRPSQMASRPYMTLSRPLIPSVFVGRNRITERMRIAFQDPSTAVFLIWGSGGIGKTTVVWNTIPKITHSAMVFSWTFSHQGTPGLIGDSTEFFRAFVH